MSKKIFRNIVISIVVAMCMSVLVMANIKFSLLTLSRELTVDSADYGWGYAADEQYYDSMQQMNKFSDEGIYQEWLVSSGSTVTGKLVRVIVMFATTALFAASIYACYISVEWFVVRLFKGLFKPRHRKNTNSRA